ncbi:hypothetical protein CCHOA_07565 [Corynebacterium choanae]|uniref:Uncharacterized protein n=1 Tax=Corynebacterium choanae TaxID=1862358 RepID=A0A3G6J720_9CORY|nr:hypothetical protein CCHOA_07565 [Corynebacterium choanae]
MSVVFDLPVCRGGCCVMWIAECVFIEQGAFGSRLVRGDAPDRGRKAWHRRVATKQRLSYVRLPGTVAQLLI